MGKPTVNDGTLFCQFGICMPVGTSGKQPVYHRFVSCLLLPSSTLLTVIACFIAISCWQQNWADVCALCPTLLASHWWRRSHHSGQELAIAIVGSIMALKIVKTWIHLAGFLLKLTTQEILFIMCIYMVKGLIFIITIWFTAYLGIIVFNSTVVKIYYVKAYESFRMFIGTCLFGQCTWTKPRAAFHYELGCPNSIFDLNPMCFISNFSNLDTNKISL